MNPNPATAFDAQDDRPSRWPVLVLCYCLSSLALASCRTAPTSTIENVARPNGSSIATVPNGPEMTALQADSAIGAKEAKAKPLTSAGLNSGAAFSSDGKRLAFLSRSRSSHRHAQVYELDLERRIERRVTFHDGDDSGVVYVPNEDRIVYASSTDELKEDPQLITNLRLNFGMSQKNDRAGKPSFGISELYVQSLNGRDLERLTDSSGYDAEPGISADGSLLVFTSARTGVASLYMTRLARGAPVISLSHPTSYDSQARFSPDGKSLVWSRFTKDRLSANLVTAPLTSSPGAVRSLTEAVAENEHRLDLHPAWHPDGKTIVFSSNRGGKGFDLYQIDVDSKCLKKLTDAAGDEIEPALSPDGKRVVFTRSWNGSVQLYILDLSPHSSCL